jgi:xylulokinase
MHNRYATLIYNQGGGIFRWFRDTFAGSEKAYDEQQGTDTYARLISEMPMDPGKTYVLPHFSVTGPPGFIPDSCGLITGLTLETTRGEILQGILEGVTFYLKECVDSLPEAGLGIENFIVTGGGSKSDRWIQLSADIMGRPFYRPAITEAGSLGVAILAGKGCGVFSSMEEGIDAMTRMDKEFIPDPQKQPVYQEKFAQYRKIWPLVGDYLRNLNK